MTEEVMEQVREKILRILREEPPDQSLPKSSFLVSMYESMLKENWKKVLPK